MAEQLEHEIKELIVEALMLEDLSPEEINSDDALFVEGLGLDSIDALELAMAVDKRWGVRLQAGEDENAKIFANVKSLAAHVSHQLSQAAG